MNPNWGLPPLSLCLFLSLSIYHVKSVSDKMKLSVEGLDDF